LEVEHSLKGVGYVSFAQIGCYAGALRGGTQQSLELQFESGGLASSIRPRELEQGGLIIVIGF